MTKDNSENSVEEVKDILLTAMQTKGPTFYIEIVNIIVFSFSLIFPLRVGASERLDDISVIAGKISPERCFGECPVWIKVSGPIGKDASSLFVSVLNRHPEASLVVINSPGGLLREAMRMGLAIRDRRLDVLVAGFRLASCGGTSGHCAPDAVRLGTLEAGDCFSACVDILAGGVRRGMLRGSHLGVHRTARKVDSEDAEKSFQKFREIDLDDHSYGAQEKYFNDMDVSTKIIVLAKSAPFDRIKILSDAEVRNTDILNREHAAFVVNSPDNRLDVPGFVELAEKSVDPAVRRYLTVSLKITGPDREGDFQIHGLALVGADDVLSKPVKLVAWSRDRTKVLSVTSSNPRSPSPSTEKALSKEGLCELIKGVPVTLHPRDDESLAAPLMEGDLFRINLRRWEPIRARCD